MSCTWQKPNHLVCTAVLPSFVFCLPPPKLPLPQTVEKLKSEFGNIRLVRGSRTSTDIGMYGCMDAYTCIHACICTHTFRGIRLCMVTITLATSATQSACVCVCLCVCVCVCKQICF